MGAPFRRGESHPVARVPCTWPDSGSTCCHLQTAESFSCLRDGLKIEPTERTPFSPPDGNPQMGFLTKHQGRKKKGNINGELLRSDVVAIFILAVSLCVRWASWSPAYLRAIGTVFHHSALHGTGARRRPDVARALASSGYGVRGAGALTPEGPLTV